MCGNKKDGHYAAFYPCLHCLMKYSFQVASIQLLLMLNQSSKLQTIGYFKFLLFVRSCCLLITFANSLDPDLTKEKLFQKINLEKNQQTTKYYGFFEHTKSLESDQLASLILANLDLF